jgi:hypothetical protein
MISKLMSASLVAHERGEVLEQPQAPPLQSEGASMAPSEPPRNEVAPAKPALEASIQTYEVSFHAA